MKGIVYGLSGSEMCETDLTADQILNGFAEVPCFECDGSAMFAMPDGPMVKCNRCKGRKTELVMA